MAPADDDKRYDWGVLALVQASGEVGTGRAEIKPGEWVELVNEVVAERGDWRVVWTHLPEVTNEQRIEARAEGERMLTRPSREW